MNAVRLTSGSASFTVTSHGDTVEFSIVNPDSLAVLLIRMKLDASTPVSFTTRSFGGQ